DDEVDDLEDLPPEFRSIDPQGIKFRNRATAFWADYCNEVRNWLARANIDQHTREVLSRSIHECANELSIVAQELMGFANDDLPEVAAAREQETRDRGRGSKPQENSGPEQDREEDMVAPPETVKGNILDTLDGHREVARVCRKVIRHPGFKGFDDAARSEIR